MRTKILMIFLLISVISCSENSDFLTDCKCSKKTIEKGIEVIDNFNRYKITFPSDSWKPIAHSNDKLGYGIIGIEYSNESYDSYKSLGIIELTKSEPWQNENERQIDIKSKYNVIESGKTMINGITSQWNLVDFNKDSIPILSLFITTEHPKKNLFYTIDLSVTKDKYGKKDLCELENFVKTFEIID